MISLMYHDVYKDSPAESGFCNDSAFQYKVSVENFTKQVDAIEEYCKKRNQDIRDVVDFTFDDGGISFYTEIAPILEKHGLRGVFFISTNMVDTPGFISKAMIKDLACRGHLIGSHSHTHPNNISRLAYDDIVAEWKSSAAVLSEILGADVKIASIPNGYYNREVLTACKDAGFQIIYTSSPSVKSTRTMGLELRGRYVVHNTADETVLLKLMSSRMFRLSMGMKYNALSLLKSLLGVRYDKLKQLFV